MEHCLLLIIEVKAPLMLLTVKKSKYEQKIVDAMAKSIEDAVAGLKEKDNGKDIRD